jgi:hypothetical protein
MQAVLLAGHALDRLAHDGPRDDAVRGGGREALLVAVGLHHVLVVGQDRSGDTSDLHVGDAPLAPHLVLQRVQVGKGVLGDIDFAEPNTHLGPRAVSSRFVARC